MSRSVKASIVVTAHNYGRYLRRCLDSALGQAYDGFEVVVVDDGSRDDTPEILRGYGERVRTLRLEGVGLAAAANRGIAASRGEYVARLDADDWLDENFLAVEANLLDREPELGMVYPDYFIVDAAGKLLAQTRLLRPYEEARLLDKNPLAAAALYRRSCYDDLGGYNESLKRQEDYDFWVRFTKRFKVRKTDLPLLYYRRHGENMSGAFALRMEARRKIKGEQAPAAPLDALAVVWAPRRAGPERELAGTTLLERALRDARSAAPRAVVATDHEPLAELARRAGVEARVFAAQGDPLDAEPRELAALLESLAGPRAPEWVAWLDAAAPLRRAEHITEALRSAALFQADAVLSVRRACAPLWRPGPDGLEPAGEARQALKREDQALYEECAAVRAFRPANLKDGPWWGRRVTYIELSAEEALDAGTTPGFAAAQALAACPS